MKTGLFRFKKKGKDYLFVGNIFSIFGLCFKVGTGALIERETFIVESTTSYLGRHLKELSIFDFELRKKVEDRLYECSIISAEEYKELCECLYPQHFLQRLSLYVYYTPTNEETFVYGTFFNREKKEFNGILLPKTGFPQFLKTNRGFFDEIGLKEEGMEILKRITTNYSIKSELNKIILEDINKKAKAIVP